MTQRNSWVKNESVGLLTVTDVFKPSLDFKFEGGSSLVDAITLNWPIFIFYVLPLYRFWNTFILFNVSIDQPHDTVWYKRRIRYTWSTDPSNASLHFLRFSLAIFMTGSHTTYTTVLAPLLMGLLGFPEPPLLLAYLRALSWTPSYTFSIWLTWVPF